MENTKLTDSKIDVQIDVSIMYVHSRYKHTLHIMYVQNMMCDKNIILGPLFVANLCPRLYCYSYGEQYIFLISLISDFISYESW